MATVNHKLHDELRSKKKGVHLNEEQYSYLEEMILRFPMYSWLIQSMYKLSKSTCNRIKYKKNLHANNNNELDYTIQNSVIPLKARELIQVVLKPPKKPNKINDLRSLVFEKINIDLSYHSVRTLIKNELCYSFK